MDEFKDVRVKAELNPGSIEDWLSSTQEGNKNEKGTRRSYLSIKVKQHLSALGWVFSYSCKGRKREQRFKSPDGKFFYSLDAACQSCVHVDDSTQQQQQQTLPKSDLSCAPSNLDVSKQRQENNKRNRVRVCDVTVSPLNEVNPSSDLTKIVPKFDVSNQQQRMKMKRVKDCYTAAFKGKNRTSGCIKIVFNIDVSNQQQKKRRKTTTVFNTSTPIEDKVEIRPRIGKSLNKILQVMEKKNKKCQKEYLRFWRKDCGPEMNYDVCCFCHQDGELLMCDGCPSAFHYTCIGLPSLPEEEELWFCPCCCCDICGSIGTSRNSKVMTCEQCQRRFHLKCLKQDPCLVSYKGWFCSSQCNRVFSSLQNLIGRKIAVGGEGDDLVWTLMRAPNDDEHYDDKQMSKLDSAVKILHQGFEPTKDPLSGRDLVEELIFMKDGKGVGRGFYTVLIEMKNEPITVAVIRVEKDVAEIPLVATLSSYMRRGMCRLLMDELEKQLSRMGVCRLVLPAAADVLTTWTQRFGFLVMESRERLKLVKHGMLHFAGTVMCHKVLMERGESRLK